jgi:hypothetical protein
LKTVLDLNTKEATQLINKGRTELGFTAPSWLSEGIDVEKIQFVLLYMRRDDLFNLPLDASSALM